LQINLAVSILTAILFAIHPMRVESVAWLTARKDLLFSFFFFAGLLLYSNNWGKRDGNFLFYSGVWSCFALALLSKILAITFPVILILVDFYKRKELKMSDIVGKIPLLLIAFIYGLLILRYGKSYSNEAGQIDFFNFIQRIAIGGYSLIIYYIKFLIPFKMLPVYPYEKTIQWNQYVSIISFIISLIFLFHWYSKKCFFLVFAFGFFLLNIFITLQIIPMGHGYLADRYTYLPYFGLFLILSQFLGTLDAKLKSKNQFIFRSIIAGLILIYSFQSFEQTIVWRNSETLWLYQIKHTPEVAGFYVNIAEYYDHTDQRIKFINAIEAALLRDQNQIDALREMGKYLARSNDKTDLQAAEKYLFRLLHINPDHIEAMVNLGVVTSKLGHNQDALHYFDQVIALDPENADAHLNKAVVFNSLGNLESAIQHLHSYLAFRPNDADKWVVLGLIYKQKNEYDLALESLNTAISINPLSGSFYFERGLIYFSNGKIQQAKSDIRYALDLGYKERNIEAKAILDLQN
jgi:tetratricopeptide (TPR) repeat protein